MPTHNPLDDTIAQRVARYAQLIPYKDAMNANGIPPEAMLMMSPDKVMPIMSPLGCALQMHY